MKEYIDNLTGLNNMLYLFENYNKFLEKYDTTYTVSIDFEKLKYINDNFGHAIGDLCIITFANIVKDIFDDSLLIRRSGDEFIIISPKSYNEIIEKIFLISSEIEKSYDAGIIPIAFRVNCGIKESEKNLKETLFKADITMYQAKNNNMMIVKYNEKFLEDIKKRDEFISLIDRLIETKDFKYQYYSIYDVDGIFEEIKEIHVRDDKYNSIFNGAKYDVLKTNYRLKRIDLANVEILLSSGIFKNDEYIINIHSQTLVSHEYNFCNHLKKYIKENEIDPKKVCLSVNTLDYEDSVRRLIEVLIELQFLGIKLCIEGVSFYEKEYILPVISVIKIDYIKIHKENLVKAMNEKQFDIVLKHMIKLFLDLNIKPIFVGVENDSELNYIKGLDSKLLIRGYHFDEEKNLEI